MHGTLHHLGAELVPLMDQLVMCVGAPWENG